MYDVVIIGCGVVGAATAYALAKYRVKAVVLEAENDVACGTSKANSAILHAGYDPKPGTLMAEFNVEGSSMAEEICKKLDVPYKRCGSLVVAFSNDEMLHVRELCRRGEKNGVKNLEVLDRAGLVKMEPYISEHAVGALLAPGAAVVSPWEFTLAMMETAVKNGVKLQLSNKVVAIQREETGYLVRTEKGCFSTRYVVNATGVFSDVIHDMAAPHAFSIRPNRGVYYLLDKGEGKRVNHIVFQCPTERGKGVLVAPTVHGNLIVGPNNEISEERLDTAVSAEGLSYVMEVARKTVPSINFRENIRNFAGVRAEAMEEEDFIIQEADEAPGFFDLAAIKSPGLTAAPAIGKRAVELLFNAGLQAEEKQDFADTRRRLRFVDLPEKEKMRVVQENAAYGRVICRCETITEGEILDALKSEIPPRSVEAVKRRCSAGMGRCQGGFCGPKVVEILAREADVPLSAIPYDSEGSYILTGRTKGESIGV